MHAKTTLLALTALLTIPFPALAFDPAKPAAVHISVTDGAGKPVSGASVHLERDAKAESATLTDSVGTASLTFTSQGNILWTQRLFVEKPGFAPTILPLQLFPGADLEQPIVLQIAQSTLIHVTGTDGKPVPNAMLSLSYKAGNAYYSWPYAEYHQDYTLRTDGGGIYLWIHGPTPNGFLATSASHLEWFDASPEITLKLTDAEIAESLPHPIAGRLLLADASPAAGWSLSDGRASQMGFSDGGLMFWQYEVPGLRPVAPDGAFSIQDAPALLFAVSPQGVPIMLTLNPASWEPGIHHLTFTLPKMSGTKSGRVLDDKNQPIPGLAIIPNSVLSTNRSWDFSVMDQNPIIGSKTLTDANGKFSIPLPLGTTIGVETDRPGWRLSAFPSLDDYHLVHSSFSQPGGKSIGYKEITVHFVDQSGRTVEPPTSVNFEALVGGHNALRAGTKHDNGYAFDKHGIHLFVEPDADKLKVQFYGGGGSPWTAFDRTLALTGKADQQLAVQLEDILRLNPLDGTVFDPAGKPASNVSVTMALRGQSSWNTSTSTDGLGRFHFDGAPASATLQVSDTDYFSHNSHALGFLRPTPIPLQHPVELHLSALGEVRIPLPQNYSPPPTMFLVPLNMDSFLQGHSLIFDSASHALISRSLLPGIYHFDSDQLSEDLHLSDKIIDIQEGKETLLNLSKLSYTPRRQRWATVKITDGGKPVSGAQVAVFTDPATAQNSNTLLEVARDLSDEQGLIRFRATIGTTYAIVSHVPGVSVGWQKLTPDANPPKDADSLITLRGLRILDTSDINDNLFQVRVSLTKPEGIEARALEQFNISDTWPQLALLLRFQGHQLTLPDLPVGTEVQLEPQPPSAAFLSQKIQITPGTGPLTLPAK